MFKKYSPVIWILMLSMSLSLGCSGGKEEKKPEGEKDKTAQLDAKKELLDAAKSRISGVWLGSAFLEEKLVLNKLEAMEGDSRQEFVASAETFLTTIMAIGFKEDGSMEQQIELQLPDGKKENMIGVGVWQILDASETEALIQITEINADGSEVVSDRICKFSENGNQFVMPAPVGDELQSCDAALIFERQVNVAENVQSEEKLPR